MMRKTFIPNWYIDQKKELQNKHIKICIVVTLLLNVAMMSLIFNTQNKLKNINDKKINSKSEMEGKVEVHRKSSITTDKYKELSDFSEQNNMDFINIMITDLEVEIEIGAKSYDEYMQAVKCLEDNYLIKKLIPSTNNEGKYNFKVILEV